MELNFILYSLQNYEEVKLVFEKLAENYGSDLKYWHDKYNSFERIKEIQKAWKRSHEESNGKEFFVIFLEFTKNKTEYLNHLSLKQLKKLGENNEDIAEIKNSKVTVFPRSFYVKQFAKRAAAGICQLCENHSPFKDKMNEPFLEVHHINYLSKGGFDNIENVVALCPNCHRKVHLLETREDYNTLLEKALKNLDI